MCICLPLFTFINIFTFYPKVYTKTALFTSNYDPFFPLYLDFFPFSVLYISKVAIISKVTRYDYNLTIMKWSLPNQIMCFLLPVDSKPTADKMSVNKSKATFEIEQCWIFAVLWWPFLMSGINSGHKKFRWNRTMLNLCSIVAAILKMATGSNFSMSGIDSGHHYLPTYHILMISDNVKFLRYCGGHFENGDR